MSAIRADLKKITGAQGALSEDRRAEVKAATDAFVASVTTTAKGLTSDVSLSEARSRLTAAAQDLRAAYAGSLSKIDCS